ncbi:MAG TPA: AAA family ATPase [bacterium]|nr:AAA family ATPase [bacterium]
MQLTLLRLLNFRNHRRTEIAPGPGLNVIVGSNAQGKTSLLEAVELAATGRSSRALREAEMVTFAEDWARVHATTQRMERREDIDLVLRQELAAPTPGRVCVRSASMRCPCVRRSCMDACSVCRVVLRTWMWSAGAHSFAGG